MTDSVVKRLWLLFGPGEIPFRVRHTISVPFRPREIRLVDQSCSFVDITESSVNVEGYVFSDLFTKGSSGDGFVFHTYFGADGYSAPGAAWANSRITFSENEKPDINGSYTFEFRTLDGDVYTGDEETSGLGVSLVLEFIR